MGYARRHKITTLYRRPYHWTRTTDAQNIVQHYFDNVTEEELSR